MKTIELEKQVENEDSRCSSEQYELICDLMCNNSRRYLILWLCHLSFNEDKLTKKSASILIDALINKKEFVIKTIE